MANARHLQRNDDPAVGKGLTAKVGFLLPKKQKNAKIYKNKYKT